MLKLKSKFRGVWAHCNIVSILMRLNLYISELFKTSPNNKISFGKSQLLQRRKIAHMTFRQRAKVYGNGLLWAKYRCAFEKTLQVEKLFNLTEKFEKKTGSDAPRHPVAN